MSEGIAIFVWYLCGIVGCLVSALASYITDKKLEIKVEDIYMTLFYSLFGLWALVLGFTRLLVAISGKTILKIGK